MAQMLTGSSDRNVTGGADIALEEANEAAHWSFQKIKKLQKIFEFRINGSGAGSFMGVNSLREVYPERTPNAAPEANRSRTSTETGSSAWVESIAGQQPGAAMGS